MLVLPGLVMVVVVVVLVLNRSVINKINLTQGTRRLMRKTAE